jgi:hypothetical protein
MGADMSYRATLLVAAALVLFSGTGTAVARAEQQPPPIHGVTGTVATEETIKDVQKTGRGIFSRVARLFGGKGEDSVINDADGETFSALTTGTAVVVHDFPPGGNLTPEEIDRLHDEAVTWMEGVIVAVDPSDRTILVRLADGARRRLQFSGRAEGVDPAINRAGTRVVVALKDAAAERVVYLFRPAS